MKKFVLYLLLVIFGVVATDFCFGLVMKSVLASTVKGDWGRRNYIVNASNEDLLILGASRAIHHYDTEIISDSLQMSCYNCGDDGMGILVHFPRFKKIIQRYHPKIVIYEVAPPIDYAQGDNTPFLGLLRPYSDDDIMKKIIQDIDKKDLLFLHSNLYKYNSSFIEMLSHRFSRSPGTAKDFTYAPLVSVLQYDSGPTSYEDEYENLELDSIKYSYLSELADICRSNGVRLVFSASPWYRMSESDVFSPIYKLCAEKGVTFLNHNFDDSFNLEKNYFHDAAHLNKYGAETFSSLIAHEIKENLYQ